MLASLLPPRPDAQSQSPFPSRLPHLPNPLTLTLAAAAAAAFLLPCRCRLPSPRCPLLRRPPIAGPRVGLVCRCRPLPRPPPPAPPRTARGPLRQGHPPGAVRALSPGAAGRGSELAVATSSASLPRAALFFDDILSRARARDWFTDVVPSLTRLLLRLPALLEDHYTRAAHQAPFGLCLLGQQDADQSSPSPPPLRTPPSQWQPVVVFAHGVGAPFSFDWMVHWKEMVKDALDAVEVVTFDYPYMSAGKCRAPLKAEKLVDHHLGVVKDAVAEHTGHPLVLMGKSMGSRVSCMVASSDDINVSAIICLGYLLKGVNGAVREAKAEDSNNVCVGTEEVSLFSEYFEVKKISNSNSQ